MISFCFIFNLRVTYQNGFLRRESLEAWGKGVRLGWGETAQLARAKLVSSFLPE